MNMTCGETFDIFYVTMNMTCGESFDIFYVIKHDMW